MFTLISKLCGLSHMPRLNAVAVCFTCNTGMLESWRRVNVPKQTALQMQINANITCKRMANDFVARQRLDATFPGRLLQVRYEDLVTDTDRVLDLVYGGLLKLPTPMTVRKRLKRQLSARYHNGNVGTKRRNGNETAYSWKQSISRKYQAYVNKACSQILSLLKYDTN